MTASLERALRSLDTPAPVPPRLPESDVSYVVEDTCVGRMLLARTAAGAMVASRFTPTPDAEDLVLARLAAGVSPRVLRRPRALDAARREIDGYLSGSLHGFDLPLDFALSTTFQREVAGRLLAMAGYGQRTTYGALARAIDAPTAVRAVGAALGANPLCVLVPCHRVVAADGALTGYAGGIPAKRFLLALESP